MALLLYLSDLMLPLVLFYVVAFGLSKGRPVYDDFVCGAKKGLKTVADIAPTLVGLLTAVSVLRASGLLDLAARWLSGLTDFLHIPGPLVPLILVRMFSSSAANGLVTDLFSAYGPDSQIGLAASLLMSCTETIFYTMSVYFVAAKVTKTRYTLAGALLATLVGTVASLVLAAGMAQAG